MALTEHEVRKIADGLSLLDAKGDAWVALMRWIRENVDNAHELATEPKISAEERAWYAGYARGGMDLIGELAGLRSGEYVSKHFGGNKVNPQDEEE